MKRQAVTGAAFCGNGFLTILLLMQLQADEFLHLDSLATRAVAHFQSIAPIEFFTAVTTFGGVVGISCITFLVIVYLRNNPRLIARLVIGQFATILSVSLIKSLIARVRPPAIPWLGQLHSYSFPSGHSSSAMMLYGFIVVVMYLHARHSREKTMTITALLILIGLIGLSRIVLAAHYASDVVAGLFLGGFWLSVVFLYPLREQEKIYLKIR